MYALLNKYFDKTELLAAFKTGEDTFSGKLISFIKKWAVSLRLVPKTMKGKEFLKRVFFGKLQELPFEVQENMAEYNAPVPITADSSEKNYKVLYAVSYVS